jgi:hypothetical protein
MTLTITILALLSAVVSPGASHPSSSSSTSSSSSGGGGGGGGGGGSSAPPPPHLSGIFLDLMESNANFTAAQWRRELEAMKAVKIEFIAIRSVMSGVNSYTTNGCKLGHFESFYNSTMTPSACYRRVGTAAPGGTLGVLLEQAMAVGIGVHFGGLMPASRFRGPGGKTPEQVIEWYKDLANLQVLCAMDVWEQFPQFRSVIKGFYTDLEESNLPDWYRGANELATHYLNPIADDVKHRLSPDLKVWASPYAVYNFTLHNRTDAQEHGRLLNATGYGQFWADVWAAAPAFDFIAPQDSMGWMGNTLPEVSASLTALHSVARSAIPARELWSNVEIFEGWPAPCNYPVRRPTTQHTPKPCSQQHLKGLALPSCWGRVCSLDDLRAVV